MTKKERDELSTIINDIQASEDKIDALERLYCTTKRLLNNVKK